MGEMLRVRMADLKIATPPHRLVTSGLGSCVGLTFYDPASRLAAMLHIMLPEGRRRQEGDEAKYADTAVPMGIERILAEGALRSRLEAKIAGGAQMFTSGSGADFMRIGEQNVEAVKENLAAEKIPLVGEDTGGHYGRTMEIDPETGKVYIRPVSGSKDRLQSPEERIL